MDMVLDHADDRVEIKELTNGKRRIHARGNSIYIHRASCDTAYPAEWIKQIPEVRGPGYLCDEISQDEDSSYIESHLRKTLFGHLPVSAFVGKRLSDFGCGSGASTMIMARALPGPHRIVGAELEETALRIARARADFYGMTNVRLEQSPAGDRLPEQLRSVVFHPQQHQCRAVGRNRLLRRAWTRSRSTAMDMRRASGAAGRLIVSLPSGLKRRSVSPNRGWDRD